MGNSTRCQKLYFARLSGAAPAWLEHPHILCHGKGEGLGQGFASCVPTFIDNKEQVNGESMSSAVSSADKQFMETRNVFFRAWFVKDQGHVRCVGQAGGKAQRGTRTWLPCLPKLFEGFCRLVQGQKVMINLPGAVILSLSERVQFELPKVNTRQKWQPRKWGEREHPVGMQPMLG